MIGVVGAAPLPEGLPDNSYLIRWGLVWTPLYHAEPVSESQALQAARAHGAGLRSRPAGAELVMFADEGSPTLSSSQPAWLFTWDRVTAQASPPKASDPRGGLIVGYWHQWNVVVSAVTGKVLEGFTSGHTSAGGHPH
jgi:hypothetical protein